MFNRIRQIHLFAAFTLTVFVLMYFVTGLVMIFEENFQRKDNSVTSVTKEIPGIRTALGDTLVTAIRQHFDVRGQYQIRQAKERTVISFRHPGMEATVVVPNHSDDVTVTTKSKNFIAALHQFHRIHGYYGGWNYRIWAFVYDLSALSMIVFAITGVYLWYKTERIRWPGWLILTAFTFFIAFTLYYLRYLR